MRAPNCPYIFQTGLLDMVCLVAFEGQPVRDVVQLIVAVSSDVDVGGSRISVTALGRLVGLGAPTKGHLAPLRLSTSTGHQRQQCAMHR
jgi:hypothetical protein